VSKIFWIFVLAVGGVALVIAVVLTFASLGLAHPVPWILTAILAIAPPLHNWKEHRGFVRWKESYSVGIETIDAEHKSLLRLINNLQSAVRYYTGQEFERRALQELLDYTKVHFAREEALMKEYNFPGYEAHKCEHDQMAAKVDEMVARYEQNTVGAMDEISKFLRKWLITHIRVTDQGYSDFLISKGVR